MKILKRSEVDVNTTWDLSDLFASDDLFYKELDQVKNDVVAFEKAYNNNIKTAQEGVKVLKEYEVLQERLTRLSTYASLYSTQDQSNKESMTRNGKLGMVFGSIIPKLNFVNQQLLQLDESVLKAIGKEDSSLERTIELMLREKPHTLSPEVEDALSELSPTLDVAYSTYNMHKLVDMKFDNVKVDEKEIPMTFGYYEDELAFAEDIDVRHAAFDTFHGRLAESQNTVASIYTSHILKEKAMAKLKGFD